MPPKVSGPKYLYIPRGLDISELFNTPDSSDLSEGDKWAGLYFVHLIITVPQKDITQQSSHGYVNLPSRFLKQFRNYRRILDWLLTNQVIEANESYSNERTKSFPKSYRIFKFHGEFHGYTTIQVPESTAVSRIMEPTAEEKRELAVLRRRYPQLIEPFDHLHLDYDGAMDYINTIEFEQTKEMIVRGSYRDQLAKARLLQSLLARKNKDLFFKLDKTSGRFHSSLTSFKKEFRHFLTHKGEPLVGHDIRASQPYLAQLLLTADFWRPSTGGHRRPAGSVVAPGLVSVSSILSRVKQGARAGVRDLEREVPPMCRNQAKSQYQQGFSAYKDIVNRGDIYDYMMNKIPGILNNNQALKKKFKELNYTLNRDSVKVMVLKAFYARNEPINKATRLSAALFQHVFPQEMAVFRKIKSTDYPGHKLLAWILQALESYIMLDLVTKNIVRRCPEAPLFTVHDSILTTFKYSDLVQTVMKDEFTSAVGYEPGIKVEDYSLEALRTKPFPFLGRTVTPEELDEEED
jgi:hypothetical protein